MTLWTLEARVWRVDKDGYVVMLPLAVVADMLYGCGMIGPAEWLRLTRETAFR